VSGTCVAEGLSYPTLMVTHRATLLQICTTREFGVVTAGTN
jgi:hypothetical protein